MSWGMTALSLVNESAQADPIHPSRRPPGMRHFVRLPRLLQRETQAGSAPIQTDAPRAVRSRSSGAADAPTTGWRPTRPRCPPPPCERIRRRNALFTNFLTCSARRAERQHKQTPECSSPPKPVPQVWRACCQRPGGPTLLLGELPQGGDPSTSGAPPSLHPSLHPPSRVMRWAAVAMRASSP
jgi:hypothetical protein